MLVTFTSNAHGDITMFGEVAERLLSMMGHSGTIPSAIFAKDIPEVLERLQSAIETEPAAPLKEPVNEDDEKQVEPQVSIANRAFPLIEMLKAAAAEDCNVMWREG